MEQAPFCPPTLRCAWFKMAPAAVGVCPTTLGTDTEVWLPDTVRTTFVVCLTLLPPAGDWSSTVPTGWSLDTLRTV